MLGDGDKSYYIKYYVNGKQYKKKIGKHSEGVREKFCANKRIEYINDAKFGRVHDGSMTLDMLADEYHATKGANATHDEMVSRYNHTIKSYFGSVLVTKIHDKDVYKFQKHLMSKVVSKDDKLMANATVNYYMTQISSMLKYAVSKGYVSVNVAIGVKMLNEDNARTRYLELEELKLLIEAVKFDTDLLLFVEMSMSTGGRMSAVMNVCKKDININHKTVSLSDDKKGEYYTAFLNERVMKLLDIDKLGMNDRIYASNVRRMQRQMKVVLDRLFNADIDKDDTKNRVVIHTLRHTFASHLAINGTPIFTIQKLLNHKDIKQTLRYAKLSPNSGREDVGGIW